MKNLFGSLLNFFNRYEIKVDRLTIKTDTDGKLMEFSGHILDGHIHFKEARKLIEKEYAIVFERYNKTKGTRLCLDVEKFSISTPTMLQRPLQESISLSTHRL